MEEPILPEFPEPPPIEPKPVGETNSGSKTIPIYPGNKTYNNTGGNMNENTGTDNNGGLISVIIVMVILALLAIAVLTSYWYKERKNKKIKEFSAPVTPVTENISRNERIV
ncbi:hypothetical protein C1645_822853 [Glomus cerebriforme]|uniref:Uncharacterized protein n=1 Tax=Glomus cerebriforme TaxID=658196 RepID=A0A397SXZ2_9GLOM|nr:hypothetical protein C1645_822853 [Glomus cerebriforme]